MKKYRIIGNMTGNSMDAIDLVMTEFHDNEIQDICTYSRPYSSVMQNKIETLRERVFNKSKDEILALSDFDEIHDEYIKQIADCINEMCATNKIDKKTIDAIGFHGKTLDHNPPSKARLDNSTPYTLQIGSGQMLSDLTGLKVIYDFRSDYILSNCEGAPLVAPHNAHIATIEGDGCYYNGGNTANFAIIKNGKAIFNTDVGPFNDYIDAYVRENTNLPFDKDGELGSRGNLIPALLEFLFEVGKIFYNMPLPKSGDPTFYNKKQVLDYLSKHQISLEDAVYTLEYFSAYIAVLSLAQIPENIEINGKFIVFGGGWKNPIIIKSFENILNGDGYILPAHEQAFKSLRERINNKIYIEYSKFGDFMEARLMADMAKYYLEHKVWEIPECLSKNIIAGIEAIPVAGRKLYTDKINRAAKS